MDPKRARGNPRAILFDAVGTLIHPEPGVAAAYGAAARRQGIALPEDELLRRFRAAFQRQEALDAEGGQRTSEARERERWRAIVAEVFAGQREPERLFDELWAYFAEPAHWAVFPEAGPLLRRLAGQGVRLAVGSNFDGRLRPLVAGLPELAPLQELFISSEVGWKKPAPAFFRHALEALRLEPGELLMVGDNRVNDLEGSQALGIAAALVDRERKVDLAAAVATWFGAERQ